MSARLQEKPLTIVSKYMKPNKQVSKYMKPNKYDLGSWALSLFCSIICLEMARDWNEAIQIRNGKKSGDFTCLPNVWVPDSYWSLENFEFLVM